MDSEAFKGFRLKQGHYNSSLIFLWLGWPVPVDGRLHYTRAFEMLLQLDLILSTITGLWSDQNLSLCEMWPITNVPQDRVPLSHHLDSTLRCKVLVDSLIEWDFFFLFQRSVYFYLTLVKVQLNTSFFQHENNLANFKKLLDIMTSIINIFFDPPELMVRLQPIFFLSICLTEFLDKFLSPL